MPRQRSVLVGASMLAVIVAIGLLAPYLGTSNPARIDPVARNKRPGAERVVRNDDGTRTTRTYWMGTDSLGRDVYSRVIYGARVSLIVGISVALISAASGLLIGIVTGYVRWLDNIVMRIMDGVMGVPAIRGGAGRGARARAGPAPAAPARPPRAPEHARAARRAGDVRLRVRDPRRGDPLLPRRRHPAGDADLGQHHGRGARALPPVPAQRPVSRRLPGRDGARCQHAGRRPARHPRPARGPPALTGAGERGRAARPRFPVESRHQRRTEARRRMSWEPELNELRHREAFAEQLGGPARVQRQHDGGRLTIRERIAGLVDPDSFHELGKIAGTAAYDAANDLAAFKPSNFVFGRASLDARPGVVGGDYHTARG